jgi:hypothetical protein
MGAYSHNNNFGPQNYSQYNSVSQNPGAFNYGSQPFNAVPSESSNSATPVIVIVIYSHSMIPI